MDFDYPFEKRKRMLNKSPKSWSKSPARGFIQKSPDARQRGGRTPKRRVLLSPEQEKECQDELSKSRTA